MIYSQLRAMECRDAHSNGRRGWEKTQSTAAGRPDLEGGKYQNFRWWSFCNIHSYWIIKLCTLNKYNFMWQLYLTYFKKKETRCTKRVPGRVLLWDFWRHAAMIIMCLPTAGEGLQGRVGFLVSPGQTVHSTLAQRTGTLLLYARHHKPPGERHSAIWDAQLFLILILVH